GALPAVPRADALPQRRPEPLHRCTQHVATSHLEARLELPDLEAEATRFRLDHPPGLPAIDRDRPTVLDPTDRHVDRWGEVADDGEPRERSPRLIGEPLRKLAVPEERLQQARHTTLDRRATGDHRRVVAQQLAGNVLAQLKAIDLAPDRRPIPLPALPLN